MLLVETVKHSRAYDWQTKQILFESIPGTLFPLDKQELLLLSPTTLYQINIVKFEGITEIRHFELGVHDFLMGESANNSNNKSCD
jgi:hypothetical protein